VRYDSYTYDSFFALVRAGLWADVESTDLRSLGFEAPVDWDEVYQLAEEQSVVGIVLAGLERSKIKPPQELLLQWIGEVQIIEQQNKAMNEFVRKLFGKLSDVDINAVLIKGQGVAQSYEKPLWRSSGDIDLLMDGDNYERSKTFLIPLADDIEKEDVGKKHLGIHINDFLIELHGGMPFELSKRVDKIVDEVIAFANTDNANGTDDLIGVVVPKADEHIVLVFTHFLHHFFIEGVGLRQICDWCRLLWYNRTKLDLRLLQSRISRMGLMTEWRSFASLAVDYLGMPKEAMPFYESRFKKYGSRIMELVVETGNFGHNKDLSYREKYSGLIYNLVALLRRIKDFVGFTMIFPVDAPKFFVNYVVRKV
jgi:hypothetical protein